MNENWDLLKQRDILDILIGEKDSSKVYVKDLSDFWVNDFNKFQTYQMPYLSGPNIVSISNKLGFNATYGSKPQSRWMYMHDLIEYCIKENKMQRLLGYLFSKEQFKEQIKGLDTPDQIRNTYALIIDEVIKLINIQLAFGDHSLNITETGVFYISKEGENPNIDVVAIRKIDMAYIKDISDRAIRDISNREFDSALTKSRTLLEEVFCLVIEGKGEEPSDKGDIGKLYNQVKTIYGMHQAKEADKRINGLLSGLEKILSSIGDMRNKASDSHGVGSKRFNIEEHHARLFVNSAMTFAEFILAIYQNDTGH